MKKSNTKRFSLLALTLLLASCGNNSKAASSDPLTPVLTPSVTKTPVPTENITATEVPLTPTETPVSTSAPVLTYLPSPAPEITDFPELPAYNAACMYMNSSNAFPLIVTQNSEIKFHYNDAVTINNAAGSTTLNLSEEIQLEGQNFSDSEAWFFCGAFQSGNMVYAHYDYLNGQTAAPSLLIRIDPDAGRISCCIQSQNPRKHFSDSFIIAGDSIYYTYTTYSAVGTGATSILKTDLNGKNTTALISGTPGETIPYLTSDGESLYYTITDSSSSSRLVCCDPSNGSQRIIASKLTEPDFLSVLNGFILTSTQNNTLTYYNQDGSRLTLKLTDTASYTTGYPMTDGNDIYVPLISYKNNASTQLAVVDLSENQIIQQLTLSDTYYYCVGMIDQFIYAENVDDYIIFDLFEAN